MKERFPSFEWGERFSFKHRYWQGDLWPLTPESDITRIATHLQQRLPLQIDTFGTLYPNEEVQPLDLKGAFNERSKYRVELIYQEPPRVPYIYILDPRIDETTFPFHPHLIRHNTHPSGPKEAPTCSACVFAPHQNFWRWESTTAADVFEQTSFWLAAHILWKQTKRWFIPQVTHDPQLTYLLTPQNTQCPCGSGVLYEYCHRNSDMQAHRKPKELSPLDRFIQGTRINIGRPK